MYIFDIFFNITFDFIINAIMVFIEIDAVEKKEYILG